MKIFAIVIVALIALGSTANAGSKIVNQLPYDMTGQWCSKENGKTHYLAKGKCNEKEEEPTDADVVLSSMRFDFYETACNINQIKEVIKNETYIVEMNCSGEGETWRERVQIRFQPFPSLLFTKQLWKSMPQAEK